MKIILPGKGQEVGGVQGTKSGGEQRVSAVPMSPAGPVGPLPGTLKMVVKPPSEGARHGSPGVPLRTEACCHPSKL